MSGEMILGFLQDCNAFLDFFVTIEFVLCIIGIMIVFVRSFILKDEREGK